ncbi:hypothetical protein AQUCO_07400049v1 [Aquilegia coerulea]|uniref:Putative rRNA methyltransferase n=1 Tax=Aquilegia coerulea TaxID=218851 RepID=A0A2G5C9L1_AQUCA|nr:hypothetical protein AQUCO_07400049v1 [Aquilegia coerulea]PIA27941.1 hypothetical protein AQUCO_07400049v1 [Aquilegia coerulea]
MGKSKLTGKNRLDKWYHLAKAQGYRSRASYKLLQLEEKYSFLNSAHSVLDLCAAPGGWMQVAVQKVPVGSFILGVDLFPIRPIRGAISVEEDITTQKCKATIKRLMNENGCRAFKVILHDGSPNVGGAWSQEATTQAALVIDSIKLATEFLAPKGIFVTKVFRSQDYNAVLYCLKQLFEKVEVTKPMASRSTSAEIYVIAQKYKAPAKIDPRLLDFKHLFQGSIEAPKVVDPLRGTNQKRNRSGYADGDTTLRKVCLASVFVSSESPLDILGSVTSISFNDPACVAIENAISKKDQKKITTEEIKSLCEDLGVLNKQDFKHLLKWRMAIRKELSPAKLPTAKPGDDENDDKGDDDDKILNEMEELTYAMDRNKKREKKKLAKRQAKEKSRKATGMQIDALTDDYVDHELFALSSIKGKKDLEVVDSAEPNDEKVDIGDSDNEEAYEPSPVDSCSDLDSDDEQRRYDEQLEEFLDQAYERFVNRTDGNSKQRKRAKHAYSKDSKEVLEGGDDEDIVHSDHDSDKDEVRTEANPLMVPLHEEELPSQDQITEKWFSQDIFANSIEERDFRKNDSDDEMEDAQEEKISISKKTLGNVVVRPKESIFSRKQDSKAEDFEIVPAPGTDSSDDSSSSSDESEKDDDTKAEILAYAKKMLRKKQREQILDDAYNKYMFDDEGLPTWFVEEERRHNQAIKPVTKEEIAAMKAQFKEIDARPAKKVAQAKARKKRVAMRKLDKVRKKANTISDQADISDRSKSKMIDKLYKQATPKKPKKEYVVAKKGVAVKGGKGKVIVDPRMKKDMRTRGMGRHGKGSAKKGKGKKGQKGKGPAKATGKQGRKGNKGKSFD